MRKRSLVVTFCAALATGCADAPPAKSSYYSQPVVKGSMEPVCFMRAPLPSGTRYTVLGIVENSNDFGRAANDLIPAMADEARAMGADAIINFWSGQKTVAGQAHFARPVASGNAIKLADRASFDCRTAGGELR